MPNNDSHHHVVKTTEQWQDRAVEYWVVPRGTLCVELTPEKKTKIKIGEGSKYYSQLPYICDGHDMSNYYTKEETDRLLDNLNRMAIQSTDVYDTKDDLPLDGNKLGDVRFVKSTSEQKVDPDVYLWNGSKWIYVGYDFANIDLDRYLTKTEFHSEFDPVRDKVDEMYPKMHTHDNKDVLDRTERPFTIADKEKLDSLENYDDTEIRELIHETGHVHWNKHILDTITEDKLWTVQDREKFESLHNYDDTELRNRMGVVESKAHTHTNKDILDQTTAPFKTEDKQKLDSLENYDIFIGTDGRYPGVKGLVPAPSALDIGTFLSSDGTWKKAGFDSDFVGATPYMDGEHGLVPAPLMGEQSYFLRGDGTWARVKNGDKYKAGEGITILSGEVISDTFPFEIFPKAATVTQYVIYGTASGVGNAVSGHYEVPIKVSAPGYSDRIQTISIADPLYDGDYIDFQRQVFAHYRTDISGRITIDPQYNYKVGIHSDGTISYHDPGAYGSKPFVSNPMEIIPGATYEITPWDTSGSRIRDFQAVMYLNMYDADMNRTRTIFQEYLGNTTIVATSNEKYMRLTRMYTPQEEYIFGRYSIIYQLYPVETPCQLNELLLYPNVVNTVDVLTTNKPNEIYVEVEEPEDIDPDDPMSEYTGIIYNDGVIDVTQEDPNNLNELTVHFRDDVDKTITIPTYELPIASDTTLGGIKVGNNLTIDPVTGVLDVTGGGTTYVEGNGIEFSYPVLETYQVLDKIRKPSGTTLTTDVMPSGTVDFFCDLKYYKYAGDSFLILCYDGERGSFCYTPAPTASGGWARMWIYTAHENWYDLYLNGSFASSSPIVAHLRWGNTMSMSFDHTSTSAQNTPGVLPGHNRFKFDSNSDADLYWAKFYENSALVGELIPVIRQSDNVVGLFNTVTETFSTVSGLTPGTPTGETIVIYDSSSTQNIPINAKLGDGLDFDSNDAIEVQPATTTTIGGIIVGENLTIDENGVLSATGGGGVLYDAGDGIEFTYNHMIDMLFDRTAFLDSVTSVQRGTISKDTTTGAFTLTATGNDAYTSPDRSSLGTVYSIQVDPSTTYKLTWTSDDPTVHGNVFVFENGDIITSYLVDQATSNELTFITSSTCQTLNFRFGVQNSGDSLTYSDISLYKITGDATINAKLGNGLQFDANGAIEATASTYTAGTGIQIGGNIIYNRNRNIPSETYRQVEYLASDGTGYILTDIVPTWQTWYQFRYRGSSDNTLPTGAVFGETAIVNGQYRNSQAFFDYYNGELRACELSGDDSAYGFYTSNVASQIFQHDMVVNFADGSYNQFSLYTTDYMGDGRFANDSLVQHVGAANTGKGATTQALALFAVNTYDVTNDVRTFENRRGGRFYYLNKMEGGLDDARTTHYLLPCYRIADDTYGVYDIKNHVFYPVNDNAGFTVGNDLVDIVPVEGDVISAKIGKGLSIDQTYGNITNAGVIDVKQSEENPSTLTVKFVGSQKNITIPGSNYVEGDAISIEHPQISSTITHVKWVLLNTRNRSSAGDIVQVGEFELYDTDDQLLTYSSISATFGNGGTPTYGTNQYQQTPDKLIDGDTNLKMCCTNFTTSCGGLEITMELMDSIDIRDIKQYRYITANDMDVRDPVTWDLYVSSDGTDWTLVGRQIDDSTIPTARETSTAYYEITHPTSDELAISVKYGNGLALDENGALTVVGGGSEYDAGPGIEIGPSPSTVYTQVEYLKSTGTQYILTDIIPDYTMRISLDVKFGSTVLSSAKSVKKIFGYYNGGSTNTSFLAIWLDDDADHGNLDYICFYDGFRWVQGGPRTNELDDVDVTTRSTVIIQRGICSWGSATCTTLDSPIAEPNPTTGMPIFAGFESNRYDIFGRRDMYLYSFKIYNSESELIHNLVPVKRNSDDELGLYDLKTNTFYTNAGTGTFTAGSEIGPIPGDDEVISAKLGYGLSFDNNDAITLDETADLVFNCDYSE